jgi:hypothetical protein
LKTKQALSHFSIKGVGQLATLPADQQRKAFGEMKAKCRTQI